MIYYASFRDIFLVFRIAVFSFNVFLLGEYVTKFKKWPIKLNLIFPLSLKLFLFEWVRIKGLKTSRLFGIQHTVFLQRKEKTIFGSFTHFKGRRRIFVKNNDANELENKWVFLGLNEVNKEITGLKQVFKLKLFVANSRTPGAL